MRNPAMETSTGNKEASKEGNILRLTDLKTSLHYGEDIDEDVDEDEELDVESIEQDRPVTCGR